MFEDLIIDSRKQGSRETWESILLSQVGGSRTWSEGRLYIWYSWLFHVSAISLITVTARIVTAPPVTAYLCTLESSRMTYDDRKVSSEAFPTRYAAGVPAISMRTGEG